MLPVDDLRFELFELGDDIGTQEVTCSRVANAVNGEVIAGFRQDRKFPPGGL